MKYSLLIITILCLTVGSLTADPEFHPRLIVAELVTASWSADAAEAYDGIDELLNNYHHGEIVTVRYYTSENGGQYSSPEIDDLIVSYGVEAFPSMIVNGRSRLSGTNVPVSSGLPYRSLIEKDYYSPSELTANITTFNPVTGEINVLITMLSATLSLQDITARFILMENEVSNEVTNLARSVEQQVFSLSGQNNTVELNTNFAIDPSWNTDNLSALFYICSPEGEIIQAASTLQTPDFYLRAVVPQQRMDVGPSSGLYEVDYVYFFNMGDTAEFTINAVINSAPENWFLSYCDADGLCYMGPYTFTMQQNEFRKFHANVIPAGAGEMNYSFVIESDHLSAEYVVASRYISDTVSYIVIDGDGWAGYETFPKTALEDNQLTFGVWNSVYSTDYHRLSDFSTLIWIAGESEPALGDNETAFLRSHLAGGNNLFISGQSIGKNLMLNPLYSDQDFFQNYLNAELIAEDTTSRQISGVEGDYISDGISFAITGGDGADNQHSPEVISLGQQYGAVILTYPDDSVAGIRSVLSNSNAKVVYLSFGFEAIDNHPDRAALLINSINWLDALSTDDDLSLPVTPQRVKLLPSYPNPFSLSHAAEGRNTSEFITIPYYIPHDRAIEKAGMTIYNVRGQTIKTLTGLELQNRGYGHITWDMQDDNNKPVSNGIYFYVLRVNNEFQARKLLIIK